MKTAIVVGGGFAGCTAANMLKNKFEVTVVEKSGVLGGGCRTFFHHGHPYTYAPHHFIVDINDPTGYDYLSQYVDMREIDHYNMTYVARDQAFYTYPIYKEEIEQMPDKDQIYREIDNIPDKANLANFEDYWLTSVGRTLYEKFYKSYSEKMWRIPNNKMLEEYSFSCSDAKEAIRTGEKKCFDGKKTIWYPKQLEGYNSYFDRCVEGCQVVLNTEVDKFEIDRKRVLVGDRWIKADLIVSTISPDVVFNYQYGELPYIGREFQKIILPVDRITPEPYIFIYYANDESFTRIVEYKLLTGYQSPHTLIIIESPSFKNKLYPYPIKSEIDKARRYLDQMPTDVYSIGRMGTYLYDDMHGIILNCKELFENI